MPKTKSLLEVIRVCMTIAISSKLHSSPKLICYFPPRDVPKKVTKKENCPSSCIVQISTGSLLPRTLRFRNTRGVLEVASRIPRWIRSREYHPCRCYALALRRRVGSVLCAPIQTCIEAGFGLVGYINGLTAGCFDIS
jgi:hypothetical protein